MRRLLDALASSRGLWVLLGIALVLSSPAVQVGFLHDDYLHRALLDGLFPDFHRGALELYDFIDSRTLSADTLRKHGYGPWWTDDDMHVRFFRPLSSLSLAADHVLFGLSPLPAHVHSLLLYLLCVTLVFAILRLLLPVRTASIAALLYAIAGSHSTALAWVAARHVLVTAVFALVAIGAHLRYRERGWRPGRWLALAALVVGAFAGETILAAVAMIGCYELFGARDPLRERAWALLPIAVLALGYLAFYAIADYGARGSALYVHPLADPGAFAWAALIGLPCLLGEMITALPSELHLVIGPLYGWQSVFGAIAALEMVIMLYLLRKRVDAHITRHVRWLGIGAVAALVPMVGGVVGGRMLAIPMLGGATVIACTAVALAGYAREESGLWAKIARLVVIALLAVNIVGSVVIRLVMPLSFDHIGEEQARIARDSQYKCTPEGDVITVAAADPSVTIYAQAAKVVHDQSLPARSAWLLSMAPHAHRIERVTDNGFDLVVAEPRRHNPWEGLHRNRPLEVGHTVTVRDMHIEVIAASPNGPTHLRVRFERRLDSPDLCFVQWRDGLMRPLKLPAPGEVLSLPFEPGPMIR